MTRLCKAACLVILGSFFFFGCRSAQVPQTGQHPQSFERDVVERVGAQYLLYLPAEYGQDDREWPLMLFLHGAGERGTDLDLVKTHGPPKLVEQGRDLPFIIVSPQAPPNGWWDPTTLIGLLDEIAESYRVDPERIYITGLSMGGYGTWELAAQYPERFAAIAPICGGGDPREARRLTNVPVWAFHGDADRTVPLARSEEMVAAVERAGGQARLTVYPGVGHDSWTQTYDNPALYDWFLQHRRTVATR